MRSLIGRSLRRLASQEGGNVLIEFALAAPILCFMLLGGLDLGRYAMQKSALGEGARAGAQYGVFNPADSANIDATVQNAAGLSGVTATHACDCAGTSAVCGTTCSGGATKQYLTVTASKTYSSIVTSPTFTPKTMTVSVTMIVPQ